MPSSFIAVIRLALVVFGCFVGSHDSFGQSPATAGSATRGGAHLYVLLGLGNNSPGLAEFGSKMQRRGIPTTVRNYGDWPSLAQEAVAQYKSGRLRSIEIVGHSLGGNAARDMAAELGKAGVPVRLVLTLDSTTEGAVTSNVRRAVSFVPRVGENHFSIIAARESDVARYVMGGR